MLSLKWSYMTIEYILRYSYYTVSKICKTVEQIGSNKYFDNGKDVRNAPQSIFSIVDIL